MKLIGNAIVYKCQLPGVADLEEVLAEVPYRDLHPTEAQRTCFVPNPETGELVTPLYATAGAYSFTVRHDEKILPKSVVRRKALDRAAEIEASEGRKVGRKEREALEEDITMALLPSALAKTTITHYFYSAGTGLLVAPVSSAKSAEPVLRLLVQMLGSMKTETLHIDDLAHGVTARVASALKGDGPDGHAIGEFILGGRCALKRKQERVTYNVEQLDSESEEIVTLIESGYEVTLVELEYADNSFFRLTDKFELKGITHPEMDFDACEDPASLWRSEADYQLTNVVGIVMELARTFDYQLEPESDEGLI